MKKKIIKTSCIILAVILLSALSAFGLLSLIRQRNVAETGNVLGVSWYNETDTEFTISTTEELLEFAKLSGFYNFSGQTIKLGADIILNEGNAEDWAENAPKNWWKPIEKFAGTFDGQNHTISGLYGIAHDSRIALFTDVVYTCKIQNTKLTNSYFKTSGNQGTASFVSGGGGKFIGLYSDAIVDHNGENVGGIVSKISKQSTIEECWYDGTINITGRDCGGIVDEIAGARAEIKHCLFSGTINQSYEFGGTRTGGIVGWVDATGAMVLQDSLASGKVNCEKTVYTGGVIGMTTGGSQNSVRNTYMATDAYSVLIGTANGSYDGKPLGIRKEELTGVKAYQWTTLDFDTYWATIEEDTPVLARFTDTSLSLDGVEKAYDTSWYQAGAFNFQIANLKQVYGWYLTSAYDTFSNKTVKLAADITVNTGNKEEWLKNAPENPWYPISNFAGIFDGQGHTISGIYSKTDISYQGLFDKTTDTSVVKNVNIKNSYFENLHPTFSAVGSIAGDFRGNLENVYSNATVVAHGNQAAGLVARTNDPDTNGVDDAVVITNCWFDGELLLKGENTSYGGGLVGVVVQGDINISHCLNTGTISAEKPKGGVMLGGLVGVIWGSGTTNMSDSLNTGHIISPSSTSVGSAIGSVSSAKKTVNITNTYTTKESYAKAVGVTIASGVIRLEESWLTGYNAYRYTDLDFPNYWAIVKTGTPILQQYASSDPSTAGITKLVDTSWYEADAKEYEIDSVEKLYGFAMLSHVTNFAGKTVKLTKDIVVNAADEATIAAWVNGTKVPDKTWLPIGNSAKPFAGTFDGQGRTISGIYLNTTEAYGGLFGYTVDTCMVKNFRLVDSFFTNPSSSMNALGSIAGELRGDMDGVYSNAIVVANGSQAGGMIGRVNDNDSNGVKDEVVITNCWYDGEFYMKGEASQDGGGIAGRLMQGDLVMEHCLNTGLVLSEVTGMGLHIGGLVGAVRSANSTFTLRDSLNTGKIAVNFPTCVGSILGRANNATQVVTIENTYTTSESYNRAIGNATTAKIVGDVTSLEEKWFTGDNAYRFSSLDYQKYWTIVKEDTPILQKFATTIVGTEELAKLVDKEWFNAKKKEHHIDTVAELYGFMKMAMEGETFKGHTIFLDKTLNINEVEAGTIDTWKDGSVTPELIWIPVGNSKNPFEGTFDGQGNTISGLYVKTGSRYAGLFGYIQNATVQNIRIEDSYLESTIAGTASLASIVGAGSGKVLNAYSNATLQSTGVEVGGIVANAAGMEITSCWYDGSAALIFNAGTDSARFGGIVGTGSTAANRVNNCLFTGTMDMDYLGTSKTQGTYGSRIGGIVGGDGNVPMTVQNTISAGDISVVWYKEASGNTASKNSIIRLDDVLGYKENADTKYSENVYSATQANWQIEEDGTKTSFSGSMGKQDLSDVKAYYITLLDFNDEWVVRKDDIAAPKELALANEVESLENVIEPDTKWYDSESEDLYIDTVEELYGMMRLSLQGKTFSGQTVHLEASLDLNEVTDGTIASWQAGTKPNNIWIPIGSESVKFQGTFDGHGNTIRGLYLKTGSRYAGLFGYVKNATIQNVRLEDSYLESVVTGTASLGSLIGCGSGTLLHSYSNATLQSSGVEVGGLVAKAQGMTIQGCWYEGTANIFYQTGTDSARFGGLLGTGATAANAISDCLFTGILRIDYMGTSKTQGFYGSRVGGLVGGDGNVKMTITNTIGAGTLNAIWHKQAAGNTAEEVTFGRIDDVLGYKEHADTKYSSNVYSATVAGWKVEEDGKNNNISGSTAASALLGTAGFYGTALNFDDMWVPRTDAVPAPRRLTTSGQITGLKKVDTSWFDPDDKKTEYVLDKEEELMGLATLVNGGETFTEITIKLGRDMVMNEVNAEILASWKAGTKTPKNIWSPIGSDTTNWFLGTFDGCGKNIKGLYVNGNGYDGFFGSVGTTGVIKNFSITDSLFKTTGNFIGSVTGYSEGTNIENVYSDAIIIPGATGNGGLVGRWRIKAHNITKTLQNCWYDGEIVINSGTVTGVGGLIGDLFGGYNSTLKVENSLFTGEITLDSTSTATASFIGGILGMNRNNCQHTFQLRNCVSVGQIKNSLNNTFGIGLVAGAMAAKAANNSIQNCYVVDYNSIGNKVGYSEANSDRYVAANLWTERDNYISKVAESVLLAEKEADLTALFGSGASDVWMCYTNTRGNAKGAPILKQFANLWIAKENAVKKPDTLWFDPDDRKTEYTLLNEEELLGLAVLVNGGEPFEGITIKLGKDMVMNEVNADILAAWREGTATPDVVWTPIGTYHTTTKRAFNGIFDGQGHSIRGVYMAPNHSHAGLFGYLGTTSTVVKNVRLVDSVIKSTATGYATSGTIVGYGRGQLINVYSNATIQSIGVGNGGIAGYGANLKITSCWYAGTMEITYTGTNDINSGGIIGRAGGGGVVLNTCLFTGIMDMQYTYGGTNKNTAFLNKYVGGLCGSDNGNTVQMNNSISAGHIGLVWKYNGETSTTRRFGAINQVIGKVEKAATNASNIYYGCTYSIQQELADQSIVATTSSVGVYTLNNVTLPGSFGATEITSETTYGSLTFQTEGAVTEEPKWYKRTSGVPVPYALKDMLAQ